MLANTSATTSTDPINNSAAVTLHGEIINTGALSDGSTHTTAMGALTLSRNSPLDFGAFDSVSSVMAFSYSSANTWSGALARLVR
jgi:hypothetical protein